MKDPMEILAGFLSRKNLRLTSQRSMILETFLKEEGHLTSEELYGIVKRKNKSIGSATVYRTLKLLSESGIAREVDFGDGVVRYEHKYGHAHHDHLICERCGKGIEVLDERIEALQKKLARKHGFILTGHKMYLLGLCPECRKKLEQ
jgi:Fur family ferric uptake transcriptional regulator